MSIELVTVVYLVGMSFAPLLQVHRMRARRSLADVSLGYLVILLIGFSLYLAYGLSIENRLLIITNTANIFMTAATIAVAGRLRMDEPRLTCPGGGPGLQGTRPRRESARPSPCAATTVGPLD